MRFTNLQAGRFAAAVVVLVFHVACHGRDYLGLNTRLVEPVPAYWFRTAIMFFFALSGFVLAHGLQTATLGGFLRSRLLRLYPAYWLAAATVLLVRAAAGNPVPFDNKGLWHAFLLWPAGPNRAAYSLGVEWTLVYELLLSLALVPFAALGRRRGLGIGAAAWLAGIVGKLVATDGRVFHPFPKLAEFPASAINAAFLLGVLAYLGHARMPRVRSLLPVVAAAALWAGSRFAVSAVGWSLLLEAVGMAAVLGYFVTGPQLPAKSLFVRGGDWSYGIYLVHVPVMTACFAVAGQPSPYLPPLALALFGGLLALAVGCAYGSFEWRMYRRMRATFTQPRPRPAAAPLAAEPAPGRRGRVNARTRRPANDVRIMPLLFRGHPTRASSMADWQRTHTCGELRDTHLGADRHPQRVGADYPQLPESGVRGPSRPLRPHASRDRRRRPGPLRGRQSRSVASTCCPITGVVRKSDRGQGTRRHPDGSASNWRRKCRAGAEQPPRRCRSASPSSRTRSWRTKICGWSTATSTCGGGRFSRC